MMVSHVPLPYLDGFLSSSDLCSVVASERG